jgi:hypothetical protein
MRDRLHVVGIDDTERAIAEMTRLREGKSPAKLRVYSVQLQRVERHATSHPDFSRSDRAL